MSVILKRHTIFCCSHGRAWKETSQREIDLHNACRCCQFLFVLAKSHLQTNPSKQKVLTDGPYPQ